MFKLMKYELRKNAIIILIMYILIALSEGYNLCSLFAKSERNTIISFFVLYMIAIVSILFIFITAIVSYSKELGSKYSYMTFMTPTSTYKIIGSKLLATALVAVATTIVAVLFFILDYNILISQFTEVKEFQDFIISGLSFYGVDVNDAAIGILVYILLMWISIFTSICIAYLAITLSKTLFANKRYRGFISVVLFFAIYILINIISAYLPTVDIGTGTFNLLLKPLLSYLLDIFTIIIAFLGSGLLLDKKVSL